MPRARLLFFALLLGCAVARADPRPEILWFIADWPPVHILARMQTPETVADLGDGQIDRVMAELIPRLPEYQHRFEQMNSRRLWRDIAAGRAICTASALKTPERLAIAYFTPTLLVAPLMVVVRADRAEKLLAGRASLLLQALLRRTDWLGLLETDRSYGPTLDALLAAYPAGKREATSRLGQTTELVAAGRADYTLDFAHTVEYLQRGGVLRTPLAVLPIQEAGDWSVGHVACTRNAWGRQAIEAIDRAIRQAAATRAYRDAYARWLPEALRERSRAQTEAFFDARVQKGANIE